MLCNMDPRVRGDDGMTALVHLKNAVRSLSERHYRLRGPFYSGVPRGIRLHAAGRGIACRRFPSHPPRKPRRRLTCGHQNKKARLRGPQVADEPTIFWWVLFLWVELRRGLKKQAIGKGKRHT